MVVRAPGSFDRLKQATPASAGKPVQTRDQHIQEARRTIGPVKIASNGQIFSGQLPNADTAQATFDDLRSLRTVDIPHPSHPLSHTLRILSLETPDGVNHAAVIQINNKDHEVEKVYLSVDANGKPDPVGAGLANSQHAMFKKGGDLHFSSYRVEPLTEQHKGLIRTVNTAVDSFNNASQPLQYALNQQPAIQEPPSGGYKGLTPPPQKDPITIAKAPVVTRNTTTIRPA